MVYKVLSFDGGGQVSLLTLLLLGQIEEQRPGFLQKTDLLAGTSAGAMNAVTFAAHDDPIECLPILEDFWRNFLKISLDPAQLLLGLSGVGSFFSNKKLAEFFQDPSVLGQQTLGDLRKKVVVTSFQVSGTPTPFGTKRWRPKIFNNFGKSDPDCDELAWKVVLRSGASPIFFPMVDGFSDGGMFANNPAMCAVAQIINELQHPKEDHPPNMGKNLGNLKMLSMGVGQNQENIEVKNDDWGYSQWVFCPLQPLLILNALVQGDELAVDYQASHVLPDGNYFRLSPNYPFPAPIPFSANVSQIEETAQAESTQKLVAATIEWIDRSGWMDD